VFLLWLYEVLILNTIYTTVAGLLFFYSILNSYTFALI
jgi:hypothetical protein